MLQEKTQCKEERRAEIRSFVTLMRSSHLLPEVWLIKGREGCDRRGMLLSF